MRIFGVRLTRDPPFEKIYRLVHGTIETVISNQLNRPLRPPEWAMTIDKDKDKGGLGLGDRWGFLAKEIIENRLYKDREFGRRFRVIEVSEKYIDAQKKGTLNDMESDVVIAAMRGKPRSNLRVS